MTPDWHLGCGEMVIGICTPSGETDFYAVFPWRRNPFVHLEQSDPETFVIGHPVSNREGA